jgi:hypothetical protein
MFSFSLFCLADFWPCCSTLWMIKKKDTKKKIWLSLSCRTESLFSYLFPYLYPWLYQTACVYVCVDPTLLKVDAKARNVFSKLRTHEKAKEALREGCRARRSMPSAVRRRRRREQRQSFDLIIILLPPNPSDVKAPSARQPFVVVTTR